MRIALISDTFVPSKTSAAVQLRDLSKELVRQGHQITVIVPCAEIKSSWVLEDFHGVEVLRLWSPSIKNISFFMRAFFELVMPLFMLRNLRKSVLSKVCWDAVVWYSPSIFLGLLVAVVKKRARCKSYLIVRDIFPEWIADIGLISKDGFIYRYFNLIAQYQYSIADTIGVQSVGNLKYFCQSKNIKANVEILDNWLFDSAVNGCSIDLSNTCLAGRKIFVYAGNMGIAQDVEIFIELAERLKTRLDIGFLFVGRGNKKESLLRDSQRRKLDNVLFFDEIEPDEIPGLYSQCTFGLVALSPRHQSHNIPGKFLTYLQSNLPVLASINEGNDLISIIENNKVGYVAIGGDVNSLEVKALMLVELIDSDRNIKERCRSLYVGLFSPKVAVNKIIKALEYNS